VRASTGALDPELGAGSKKTHAPKLDAFNMKSELEEGGFDEQDNYVRKAADADAQHDIWLEGMSKKEMKKAKAAADKREAERMKRDLEDDAKSNTEILTSLIPLLERGETVLEALARLGKAKEKKHKWQTKNKKVKARNGSASGSTTVEEDAVERSRREKVEAITEAADFLMVRGQAEIYDTEREILMRQYRKEAGEEWSDPPEAKDSAIVDSSMEPQWEYKWTDARDGGAVNGPYDANTMKQWNDAGYFGDGVEFRRKDGSDWTRVAEFA
jgi:CD2 antigen cytoplasmic tail-binding protein 2